MLDPRPLRQTAWVTDFRAVFVFTRDGDMLVFRDKLDAVGYLEAVDVLDGEYEVAYFIDGSVLEVVVLDPEGVVSINDTTGTDSEGLRQRIGNHLTRSGSPGSADDPQAVADEYFRWEWEHRWPRWPSRLPRLGRHGSSGGTGTSR